MILSFIIDNYFNLVYMFPDAFYLYINKCTKPTLSFQWYVRRGEDDCEDSRNSGGEVGPAMDRGQVQGQRGED